MQPSRRALVEFVLDNPLKKLRRTAQKVERWRTRRLAAQRTTTNPHHKEQYVNAYVEAQSALMVHRHAIDVKAAASTPAATQSAALTTSEELTRLASELEATYRDAASSTAAAPSTAGDSAALELKRNAVLPAAASNAKVVVPFGAWRSAEGVNARLAAQVRSVDVVRHCVIREARTPPALSPEVLERALPRRPPAAVRALLTYIQSRSFRAGTHPVDAARLQGDLAAALKAVNYSRETQRSVALYVVYVLSRYRDWETSSQLVRWLHEQWPSLAGVESPCWADTSLFVALLFDTARVAAPLHQQSLPTLDGLDEFCAFFDSVKGGQQSVLDPPPSAASGLPKNPFWEPVVAAPLLSVAGLRESMERLQGGSDHHHDRLLEQMQRLVERYCISRSVPQSYRHTTKTAQALAYMPALAWGEYLRAMHRCGASLAALQAATDRLTDPSRTRHATRLLSSTHVWNAYLACSPGPHAAEVYEQNLRHYKVTETPATVAAVMTALLAADSGVGEEQGRAQARVLWGQLHRTATARKMVATTCSTVVAHARLLAAEGNRAALRDLLLSYESLYEGFGSPSTWFQEQMQKEEGEDPTSLQQEERDVRVGVRLLHRACAAYPLLVPPIVQQALLDAVSLTRGTVVGQSASSGEDNETSSTPLPMPASGQEREVPEMTAEDLAAML